MERDDWTRQQDRDRQADWRRRQDDKGMVQVRVWVPQNRAAGGDGGSVSVGSVAALAEPAGITGNGGYRLWRAVRASNCFTAMLRSSSLRV